MEKWEKNLRDRLDKELSEGLYTIGTTPFIAQTGKQGKIEYEVDLERAFRNNINSKSFYDLNQSDTDDY